MRAREILGTATTPAGETMVLAREGGCDLVVRVANRALMSSRAHESEEELARVGCDGLRDRKDACVLVGGLGMGYTLRAALDLLGPGARVVVAELMGAVVDWCRTGPLADLAARPLDDQRVEVVVGDVLDVARAGAFDAILLDVDNGPDAFSMPANARLYEPAGLRSLGSALRKKGVLAIWSQARDQPFERKLRQSGFRTEIVPARASRGKGSRHVLYVAHRQS